LTAAPLWERVPSSSFLEWAFLRWVLSPARQPEIVERLGAQVDVEVGGRRYRLDYELTGARIVVAVELDGFEFHGTRWAFTYDRARPGGSRLVGDVAPEVRQVAGWVAPNPGGVGPMTRAMLLTNVVEAAEQRLR
jgi:hypothetical protein